MRFRLPGKWELGALSNVGYLLTSIVGRTMRITLENGDEVLRRLSAGEGQILVTWHGRTIVPLFYFRHRGFVTIISPSRDGEIQYRVYRRFGWDAVRGSTGRDAARAALGSVRHLREGRTLALAPDGPKGPSGVVQPGTLYLARKSGCPVIPAGVSAWPTWHMKSWDAFLAPKPFSKAAITFGEPLFVPEDASPEWQEEAAERLGRTLDDLQSRADRLVGYPEAPSAPDRPESPDSQPDKTST